MNLELLSWTTSAASILGGILNIKKNNLCFYIWAVTNFTWMVIDFKKGLPAQGTLFAIYFILALWGIYSWKRKEH